MRLLIALPLLLACGLASADEIDVRVQRREGLVIIDVETTVDAPLADAFAVFTDYDHMTRFVTNVKESRVVARHGNVLDVEQAGDTRVLFMHFAFKAVRRVELVAQSEIRSSLLSGDFKSFVSTTRFSATRSGVHIAHHGEYAPKSWLPPLIGPMVIAAETRKQYRQFIAEIERRKAAQTPP